MITEDYPPYGSKYEIRSQLTSSSLGVLLRLRSLVGVTFISDLLRYEHQTDLKQALAIISDEQFSLKQWDIAATYLAGRDLNIRKKEDAVDVILRYLRI